MKKVAREDKQQNWESLGEPQSFTCLLSFSGRIFISVSVAINYLVKLEPKLVFSLFHLHLTPHVHRKPHWIASDFSCVSAPTEPGCCFQLSVTLAPADRCWQGVRSSLLALPGGSLRAGACQAACGLRGACPWYL